MNTKRYLLIAVVVGCIGATVWDAMDANKVQSEINESRRPRTETHYGPAF